MYCNMCGVENPNDSNYCKECGANLQGKDSNKQSVLDVNSNSDRELFAKAANLFRGIEAVGGKIYFYDNRLIFKSHSFNIQTGETTIYYSDIVLVEKVRTGIVPNGMLVTLRNGAKHRFVLWNRSEAINFLNSKIV